MLKKILIGLLLIIGALDATYISTPYSFVPRELISSTKINANWSAYEEGLSDASKDINLYRLYVSGQKVIDFNKDIYCSNLLATGNFTVYGDSYISGNSTVTGDFNIVGTLTASNSELTVSTLNTTDVSINNNTLLNNVTANGSFNIVNSCNASAYLIDNNNLFTSGSDIPSTTPDFIGQKYIDTTNHISWFADGTASSLNWVPEVGAGLKFGHITSQTSFGLTAARIQALRWTPAETTVLRTLQVRFSAAGNGHKVRMAIYSDDNVSPNALLAESEEYVRVATDENQFVRFPLKQKIVATAGTYYWIAIFSDSDTSVETITNSGTTHGRYISAGAYGAFPDPFGNSTAGAYEFCISAW